MDELEWSDCNESLDDILTNPKVQLPQVIKLASDLKSINSDDILKENQLIIIHEQKTVAKLEGLDGNEIPIRLPVSCPFRVRLRLAEGKEKTFDTILDLTKADPLPKLVEVTKVTGLESVSVGDRLKVVIVEKIGSIPAFIHLRSSTGKHVKIAVDQDVAFKLAVNDASEQLLSNLAEKSRELPLVAEFVKNEETPKTHTDLRTITITKGFTEKLIIASAKKENVEYAVVFPLNSTITFQVNSKLKLAKDEQYRELCSSASDIDVSKVSQYLDVVNPSDEITRYVIKYKNLLKLINCDSVDSDSDSETDKQSNEQENNTLEQKDTVEPTNNNTLKCDQVQRGIVKKEQKERERLAKLEKERLKAEKKREKKEKKEKEKEEKKKRKSLSSSLSVIEKVDEDMYIVPETSLSVPTSPVHGGSAPNLYETASNSDSHQSQWALQLMKKVKNIKDRTKSVGAKQKKRPKLLRKDDIVFDSSDNILNDYNPSVYAGLNEGLNEDLYETLPGDMAYESLDLIAQAQRSLVVPAVTSDHSGDSGFDEVDQAKIRMWRESMVPPPLPGNHPHQDRLPTSIESEDMYEVAIDCSASNRNVPSNAALQTFYDIVQQSAAEISTWSVEDVANCLSDLKLGKYEGTFADSLVDGHLLLDLDESVLIDLGLSLFEARKLRKFTFGWRPDITRPLNYPELKGFESKNPADWAVKDVVAHLRVIDIHDFAEFCELNQVNGDLLKDLCVDDAIMNSIITSRDRKLKTVKIKNYVIDQWRPKKKGEGNYATYTAMTKNKSQSNLPLKSTNSTPLQSNESILRDKRVSSTSSPQRRKTSDQPIRGSDSKTVAANSSPKTPILRKLSDQTLGVSKKPVGDAPLVARMKQQLEEKKNDWETRKKTIQQQPLLESGTVKE